MCIDVCVYRHVYNWAHTHTHTHIHTHTHRIQTYIYIYIYILSYMQKTCAETGVCQGLLTPIGGARGVIVIVVGNGHGDTSSNPEREWLHFT